MGCNNSVYSKSHISTSTRIGSVPKGCTKLRDKILKRYHDIFKDKLDEHDRINIKPVHLKIDASRNIIPKHCNKPYDIPFHLRSAATTQFNEMLRPGVITATEEATGVSSPKAQFEATEVPLGD